MSDRAIPVMIEDPSVEDTMSRIRDGSRGGYTYELADSPRHITIDAHKA